MRRKASKLPKVARRKLAKPKRRSKTRKTRRTAFTSSRTSQLLMPSGKWMAWSDCLASLVRVLLLAPPTYANLVGDLEPGDSWLAKSLGDLQGMWEKAVVNQFEVSLLILVERSDVTGVEAEVKQMEQVRQDWGPLITTLLKIHAKRGDLRELMDGVDI